MRSSLKRSSDAWMSVVASAGMVRNGASHVSPLSLLIAYARLPSSVPRSRAEA